MNIQADQVRPSASRLMTINEVAAYLRVAPRTVYRWCHEDYIPSIKLGSRRLFRLDAIDRWVSRQAVEGRVSRLPEVDLP